MKADPNAMKSLLQNPAVIALLAALVTIIILTLIAPPFVKISPQDATQLAKVSPWKVLAWGAFVGLAVLILPVLTLKVFKREECKTEDPCQ